MSEQEVFLFSFTHPSNCRVQPVRALPFDKIVQIAFIRKAKVLWACDANDPCSKVEEYLLFDGKFRRVDQSNQPKKNLF